MKTATVIFQVPQDLLASLKVGVEDLGRSVRLMAAIAFFKDKKLSLGKAAELAGINRLNFMEELSSRGLTLFDYDETELESDLQGIARLRSPEDDH